jgi:hypothetical protein
MKMDDQSLKDSCSSQTPSEQELNGFVSAAGRGDVGAVTTFIDKYKGFLDLRDSSGNTALTWAVTNKQKAMVELLLSQGAGLATTDKNGWPPLMHAAWHGLEEMVDFLVEKGAAVDDRDSRGQTSLMRAASIGQTGAVRRLLEKGASLEEIDFSGKNALMIAKNGRPETVALLKQWPEIQKQRAEEARALAEKRALMQSEAEARKKAEVQLEKLKNRRPPNSPFKKDKP